MARKFHVQKKICSLRYILYLVYISSWALCGRAASSSEEPRLGEQQVPSTPNLSSWSLSLPTVGSNRNWAFAIAIAMVDTPSRGSLDAGGQADKLWSTVNAARAAKKLKRNSQVGGRASNTTVEQAQESDEENDHTTGLLPTTERRLQKRMEGPKAWWDVRKDIKGLWSLILGSWQVQILQACTIALYGMKAFMEVPQSVTFFLAFAAIVPSAVLLGDLTEELAAWVGDVIGGLLNATVGNITEVLVSVVALNHGMVRIVQASLIGSVLSNILFVLGMAFFVGGIRYRTQFFNPREVVSFMSNLLLAMVGVATPTLFSTMGRVDNPDLFSTASSAVLLSMYACHLLYTLLTHREKPPSPKAEPHSAPREEDLGSEDPHLSTEQMHVGQQVNQEDEDEEDDQACTSAIGSTIMLAAVSVLVGYESDDLIGAIEPVSKNLGLSSDFIGVVLLPIVGNAAEHMTAIFVAANDKLDLSIGVGLGSALQIALGVVPFLVLLSHIVSMEAQLTLIFPLTYVVAFISSVVIVAHVLPEGVSNWMKGVSFLAMYFITAIAFFVSH